MAERIRALARATTDWPCVLHTAGEHGVRPLLYRSLSTFCPDIVPESVLEDLLGFVQTDVARNMCQNAELLRLLDGLKERGIPAIPFKGAVLASWAYDDPALRESGDIDIVIRKRNLREAMSFLVTQGYRTRAPQLQDAIVETDDDDFDRYLRFDRTDGLASVDLQCSLEAPHFSFTLDDDELWNHTISRRFVGQTVSSFCAEDLLILLCVHGTKDVWFKLKWICDIAEFVERGRELNWDHLLRRATRLRARRKVLLGCVLAYELLGARVPEEILTDIRREPMVRASAETIMGKLSLRDRRFTNSERAALYFRTDDARDRTRRGLAYVRRSLRGVVVPSDNDRRWLHLPDWLSRAYYLVRPMRLIVTFGTRPRLAMGALKELFESLT